MPLQPVSAYLKYCCWIFLLLACHREQQAPELKGVGKMIAGTKGQIGREDTLSAMEEIEAVNRSLLMERLSELKDEVEDAKLQIRQLSQSPKSGELIASQTERLRTLGAEISELEKEVGE